MKVALVYDRVNKWGGVERVLLALHEMFPKAPLYTSVYDEKKASWAKVFPQIYTSFIQKLPILRKKHELLGWLMPLAFETFDFADYDLVISVTSEAGKGIITKPSTKHLCYCLTPTRYLWSGYKDYFRNIIFRFISLPVVNYLKTWDKIAAQRPDRIIAISNEVKNRIKNYYNRNAFVLYPPFNFENSDFKGLSLKISDKNVKEGEYFLLVSRLVPYKKVDLAIRAFNKLGYPLLIVGTGSEERKLKRIAKKNISFVKNLTDNKLADYYHNARALIMPQEEDFGLVAVEAQFFGCPVVAFNKGGACDTVIEGITGTFFEKPTVDSLVKTVKRFGGMKFNTQTLTNNAKRFSKDNFIMNFNSYLKDL